MFAFAAILAQDSNLQLPFLQASVGVVCVPFSSWHQVTAIGPSQDKEGHRMLPVEFEGAGDISQLFDDNQK